MYNDSFFFSGKLSPTNIDGRVLNPRNTVYNIMHRNRSRFDDNLTINDERLHLKTTMAHPYISQLSPACKYPTLHIIIVYYNNNM